MPADAKVLVDAFDLTKQILPAVGRSPRSHRFTLGKWPGEPGRTARRLTLLIGPALW